MARPAAPYRAVLIACDTPVDRRWSGWLTARLRRFRTPHALMRAGVAQRVAPIVQLFASAQGDLSEAACAILAHCDALVVVCSTATPASRWIASAIHHYRETAGRERIFALLAEGEPDQAFPEALLRRAITREREGGLCETVWEEAEPIAADVRPRADEPRRATLRRALLRTAAGLLGVSFDQLARRERHRRLQRQRLIGGLCAGALAAGAALAWWQWDSRQLKRAYYEAYATH
ncbi:MAG TPA: hypothetical protein VFF94_09465, partial [Novosphingobium sp.]|nr:hypothetical protein [Novosphingobium sp.]